MHEPTEIQATKEKDPEIPPIGIIRYRGQNSSALSESVIYSTNAY